MRLSEPKTKSSIRLVPIIPTAVDIVKKHIECQKEQANCSFGCYEKDPFLVGSQALGSMVDPEQYSDALEKTIKLL